LATRAVPLLLVGAAAFAIGVVTATGPSRAERKTVTRYVRAWARGDWAAMYALLDDTSRAHISKARFIAAYQQAADTATTTSLTPLHVYKRSGDAIPVLMRVHTRLFGNLTETMQVPLSGSGSDARVHFTPQVTFPGLGPRERLNRHVTLPPRGTLLASDGTPLAEGPDRTSPIPSVASEIVGRLGAIPLAERAIYARQGYPSDAQVGQDGLERVFERQLAGMPGGTLRAGHRVLAQTAPKPGQTVKTTIVPKLEEAAVAAEAGRYAGITVMDPRTGALLALAGVAFSALQPPGSTMKMVTATGALDAGIATLGTQFPVQTGATLDGYTLENAGGEACGGTLLNAFAVSCNSVFAPLGAKLGAKRLVDMAERFGFNQPTTIPGAAESTIPSASTIGDDLAVGSSAIGQGKVQATALEMTDIGATIAMGGKRPLPTLAASQAPRFVRVTSRRVANEVERMMVAVVSFGTGTPAQIPGVKVAGKTGTAELRTTQGPGSTNTPDANSPANTDSWFVGYAPVGHPRVVVGALFPAQGAGAQTAAPAVRDVLAAALASPH
jgi:cell division protein FtsI/penicillin-binding protein 2